MTPDIWTPILAVSAVFTVLAGLAVFILRLWFRAELADFKNKLAPEFFHMARRQDRIEQHLGLPPLPREDQRAERAVF
jgi:hypothetical protein